MEITAKNRTIILKLISSIFIILFTFACTNEEEPDEQVIVPGQITFNSATLYWINTFPNAEHTSIQIYLKDNLITELENTWFYKLTNLDENTSIQVELFRLI